jgi:hypothetical protein
MSELVVVRAFSQPHEAHLACSALRAAGLDVTTADDNIVAADWLYSNAVGGVKVLVRPADVVAAQEILDSPAVVERTNDRDLSCDPNQDDSACPRCGSHTVITIVRGIRTAVFSWLLMGVPLFPVSRQTRCQSCGFVLCRRSERE